MMKRGPSFTAGEKLVLLGVSLGVAALLLIVRKDTEVERHSVFIPVLTRTTLDSTQEPEEVSTLQVESVGTEEEEVLSAEELKARSVGMTFERSMPISVSVQEK